MKERFIDPAEIPIELWDKSSANLELPADLIAAWVNLLKKNNLLEIAKQKAESGFTGGLNKEDTDKHLAWRYNGSCARVLLSLLDPKKKLSKVSDAYAATFAGGKVFLADMPSGSGAAVVCILCTLMQLRRQNVLPRNKLDITILGAEISPTARGYMEEQLRALAPALNEEAISIKFETIEWDVLCKLSTAKLIQKATLLSQNSKYKILVLCNFTGFLKHSDKWKKANTQFENIFLHCTGLKSTAIWIEPKNKAVTDFFVKVVKWFKVTFRFWEDQYATNQDSDCYAQADGDCKQPLKDDTFQVGLTVARFDLSEEPRK